MPASALDSLAFARVFSPLRQRHHISAAASAAPEDFLTRLGLADAELPEELLIAGGWQLIAQIDTAAYSDLITQNTISGFVQRAWPATVRLSYNRDSADLCLWQHPNPAPVIFDSSWPSTADVRHAIRVITAIGIARATDLEGAHQALAADQAHFEAVAAALEAHAGEPGAARAAAA